MASVTTAPLLTTALLTPPTLSSSAVNAEVTVEAPPQKKKLLPWALGIVFALMAGSLSLPITAYSILIYRRLELSPAVAGRYYLAEFSLSFTSPIVGWITDRGGPAVRWVAVVCAMALKTLFLAGFALGWVTDEPSLYAFGVPLHAAHAVAIATLNGALVAKEGGGSGDTSFARGRQAAKLAWQTGGDLVAALLSLALAASHASIELMFWTTAGLNLVVAIVAAIHLPRRAVEGAVGEAPSAASAACAVITTSTTAATTEETTVETSPDTASSTAPPSASPATAPGQHESAIMAVRAPPPLWSDRRHAILRVSASAIIAAIAVGVYMLPPTSDVALSAYVARPHAVERWVLSGQQISTYVGGLIGIALMWRLDLRLFYSIPIGAAAVGLAELTALFIYAIGGGDGVVTSDTTATNTTIVPLDGTAGGVAILLLQPAIAAVFGRCGTVAVLALGAAAAEGGGEGAAFGLASAADGAGSLAAGTLSSLAAASLHLGEDGGAQHTWSALPAFVGVCAAAKLCAAFCVLALLKVRERVYPKDARIL